MSYNWNVDTTRLKKDDFSYQKWENEQLINFGLNNKKLSRGYLLKNLSILNIDKYRRKYLEFLLWPNQF